MSFLSLAVICFTWLSLSSALDPNARKLVVQFQNNGGSEKFSWKSCGTSSYPSRVDNIYVLPDPLKLPGNVSIGFKGQLNVDLDTPLKLEIEIKKKVLVWIRLPCLDGVGSCTYYDICTMIPQLNCPSFFQQYHIPCKCPISAGSYKLPPSPFYIDTSSVPEFLTSGDYQLTAKLSNNDKYIVCLNLEFSID